MYCAIRYCFYTSCMREMHDICYTWDGFSNEANSVKVQSGIRRVMYTTLVHSHSGLKDVSDHALLWESTFAM